jgi:hypothetical protein
MLQPIVLSDAPLPRDQKGVKYFSKIRPDIIVEVVDHAELRIAETRREVVIYRRNERLYVRTKAEFLEKFCPLTE